MTDNARLAYHAITKEDQWLNTSRPLKPEDLENRIILLDFWTFCCINCIHIIPDLHKLEKEFGDQLTVIGVHSAKFENEKDTGNIRSAILRYEIEHPVVNDARFRIWTSFGARAWPTLVLLAPNAEKAWIYSGEGHLDELRAQISDILRKSKDINRSSLPIKLEKDKLPSTPLLFPGKITHFKDRNLLLISDSNHNRIVVAKLSGEIVEIIGSGAAGMRDGDFSQAEFFHPQGLIADGNQIYVADTENHALRLIDWQNKTVSTVAGTGKQGYLKRVDKLSAKSTPLSSPWDVEIYEKQIVIAMAGCHQLWTYDPKSETVSLLVGNGRESIDDGPNPINSLSQTSGLSVNQDILYFVDSETSSLRILQNKSIETLIGTGLFDFGFKDGLQGQALMQHPIGLDAHNDKVYIADTYNHSIRFFDTKIKKLYTLSGQQKGFKDGDLSEAMFFEPNDVLKIDEIIYVADTNNHQIRYIDLNTKQVNTLTLYFAERNNVFIQNLPAKIDLDEENVASNQKIKLSITLKNDFYLNKEAPSWLKLFKQTNDTFILVQEYGLSQLNDLEIFLEPMDSGESYILQGIIYYCAKENQKTCLISGIEQKIKAGNRLKHGGNFEKTSIKIRI